MSKDDRAGVLRVFRIVCAVLVLALLGVAVVYAVLEISPAATLAGQATRAGDALALVARFYQWMLARKVLNVAVLVVCAALFLVMAAKKKRAVRQGAVDCLSGVGRVVCSARCCQFLGGRACICVFPVDKR